MGGELERFLQIVFVAVILFAWIGKIFYNVFIRPFRGTTPPPTAVPRAKPPSRDLRDFLSELRRDLGHGSSPPRSEGLLDQEGGSARLDEPAAEPALRQEAPPEPARMPHRPSAHPQGPVAAPVRPRRVVREESPARASIPREVQPMLVQLQAVEEAANRFAAAEEASHESLPGALGGKKEGLRAAIPGESEPRGRAEGLLQKDLEAAVILREILGPPRAHRPRGRGRSPV